MTPGAVPMAQSAARIVSARGAYRARHGRVRFSQGHERGAEVDGHRGQVERVHAVHDPVGPAVAQELGDAGQARIVGRSDAVAAEHDGFGDRLSADPLGGLAHPGVVPLAQHDALAALGRALQQRVAEAHRAYRWASAFATAGETSALTSPPKRATSRTRLELR